MNKEQRIINTRDCQSCMVQVKGANGAVLRTVPGTAFEAEGTRTGVGIKCAVFECESCERQFLAHVTEEVG